MRLKVPGQRRLKAKSVRAVMPCATASPPRPSLQRLEDAEDYQAFEAAVTADYDAETAVERELVLRLASVLWRLRRATGIETALFESVIAEPGKLENGCPRLTLVGGANLPEQNQLDERAARQSDAASKRTSLNPNKDIGDCFLRLAELPTFALDRLSRYEHLLWRQSRQIVFTLESLRRRKRAPNRLSLPFSACRQTTPTIQITILTDQHQN